MRQRWWGRRLLGHPPLVQQGRGISTKWHQQDIITDIPVKIPDLDAKIQDSLDLMKVGAHDDGRGEGTEGDVGAKGRLRW